MVVGVHLQVSLLPIDDGGQVAHVLCWSVRITHIQGVHASIDDKSHRHAVDTVNHTAVLNTILRLAAVASKMTKDPASFAVYRRIITRTLQVCPQSTRVVESSLVCFFWFAVQAQVIRANHRPTPPTPPTTAATTPLKHSAF